MNRKVELLSPAGSFESLMAAIQGGCDAVYFGIEQLNMRARSTNNFTLDDLKRIAGIAHEHRIKAYLTLNTILYDHDLRLMRQIVDAAAMHGIDAVIASDHAAMQYARKAGLPVHISTQANISNIETVEFYSAFADTMVLARELSLGQVADIAREIRRRNLTGPSGRPVALEVFAHGALCMAISGKCYLSLHTHQASANRGACVQNCRRSYIVTDKDEGYELEIDHEYIMSAKDLCTLPFLDQVLEADIAVLKIEGRGRSADYVYTTTKCYREAIQAIGNNCFTKDRVEGWMQQLETVYNRGFWDGYYLGKKMGEWSDSYGSKAKLKKLAVGKAVGYFPKAGAGEFVMESHKLQLGDQLMLTGPTTGYMEFGAAEFRVNQLNVSEVQKGDRFTMPAPGKIRPGDKLYKVVSADAVSNYPATK